ncbi:MAG TPA: hypothetical protein VF339_07880 [Gammaproteobacteria bacterium]
MFELLFKYSPETFSRSEFVFARELPMLWLALLAAVAVAIVAASIVRMRQDLSWPKAATIGALQAALLIAVLFLLWRPALVTQTLRPQENSVAVLLDTSASMSYGEGDRSRLQQAVAVLGNDTLPALSADFTVDLFAFDSRLVELPSLNEVPAPGTQTRIGDALLSVLRSAQTGTLGAVVLVSDGGDNSNELDAARIAEIASHGVPVHTVGVGRERLPEDVELEDVVVPTRGLAGSTVSAEVSIRHAAAADVDLRVYDGDAIIASERIRLPSRPGVTTRTVDIDVGEPGIRDLRFTLSALPGERNLINNTQLRPMEVPRERRHVLYVEGEPRWEYKFIRRALDENPSVRLASLLKTTANKFYRQGVESADELAEGFPTDEETLFGYDALMIGSFEAAALTPAQHQMIADFVSRRGGGLLMLGGRRGLADGGWGLTVLADVLPVKLPVPDSATFIRYQAKVLLTEDGKRSLLTRLERDDEANVASWAEMPEIIDFQYVGEPKPGAITLLEAELPGGREPLLVHQHYGLGNAYVLATGGTWRWQMGLPHEDQRHETFWRQLLQTLSAAAPRPVTLTTDRAFYGDDSRISLRAEVRDKKYQPARDATVTVTVDGGAGTSDEIELEPVPGEPGVYAAVYDAAEPGIYRFTATATATAAEGDETLGTAQVAVRRADGVAEHFHVEQNRALLERIANATGGTYFALADAAKIPEVVRFSEAGLVERQVLDLWNMPIVFVVLLLLKGTEWILRLLWGRL